MDEFTYYQDSRNGNEPPTIYRLNLGYFDDAPEIQEVYDRDSGAWKSTDELVRKLVQGDLWLHRLDEDPTANHFLLRSDSNESVRDQINFQLNPSNHSGDWIERSYQFGEVEPLVSWALDSLKNSGREWALTLQSTGDPAYVQVAVSESGSLWPECSSYTFLERHHEAQRECLLSLGWQRPSPPTNPNWCFHDERFDTGTVVGALLVRTMRQVMKITSDDVVKLSVTLF